MGVSSFAIIFMKLKLEWHSIIFTSLGGIAGIIFGKSYFQDDLNLNKVGRIIMLWSEKFEKKWEGTQPWWLRGRAMV